MSLFGTLRKKGKKIRTNENENEDELSSKSKSLSSSTPNLDKLNASVPICTTTSSSNDQDDSTTNPYNYERNPRPKYKLFDGNQQNPSQSRSPSPSLLSVPNDTNSIQEIPNAQTNSLYTKNPKNVPKRKSSMRQFVSIVSTATGLKKSTSTLLKKKPLFHSELQLRPHPDSETDSISPSIPNTEEELSSTPNFNLFRKPSSVSVSKTMKGSRSEPHIQLQVSLEEKSISSTFPNNEPGVISSSSSLCSSNNASYLNLGLNLNSSSQNPSQGSGSEINLKSETTSEVEESYYSTITSTMSHHTKEEIARTKLMLQGAKKFNMEPKRGIDYLVLNGIITRTPESVAQYLKDGEALSKTAIGNYLGEHHAFNLEVLNEFVKLHDFTNVLLVQALRQFLWSFRLPGEAQKIDRMMECFAKRYTELNPTLFANSDTCYLLSFAIIMLNTSLHNPSVKNKPTLEQFIQMNRDIDAGQPLESEFITSLYNSILTEPFQIPPEDGNDLMITFFNPEIEGWLWKQCGERYKTWKRRWFILSNNCLYYFLFTTDKDPRGIIPLENTKAKKLFTPNEASNKRFCFTLYKDSVDPNVPEFIKSCKSCDGKLTAGKHTKYQLATTTSFERDRWISAVNQNSSNHDFYTLLEQKKKKMETMTKESQNPSIYYGSLSRRNKNSSKPQSPIITASVRTVRKSQISLPLKAENGGSPVSLRQQPQIQHSLSTSQLSTPSKHIKDRHAYFYTSASSASINLEFNVVSSTDNEQYSTDDDESTHVNVDEDSLSTSESPETERRKSIDTESQTWKVKGRNSPQHWKAPKRKASLPSYCKLLTKIDYLTEPGIRISIEDTDEQQKGGDETLLKGLASEQIDLQQEASEFIENVEIAEPNDETEPLLVPHSSEVNYKDSPEESPNPIEAQLTVPNAQIEHLTTNPVHFRRANSKRKKCTVVTNKRRSAIIKSHHYKQHKKKHGVKLDNSDEGIGQDQESDENACDKDFEIDEPVTNDLDQPKPNELLDLNSIINDCAIYLENISLENEKDDNHNTSNDLIIERRSTETEV